MKNKKREEEKKREDERKDKEAKKQWANKKQWMQEKEEDRIRRTRLKRREWRRRSSKMIVSI